MPMMFLRTIGRRFLMAAGKAEHPGAGGATAASVRNPLEEFFEADRSADDDKPVVYGRSWKASELRLKSWDDLQKLWYVLLKEKNILMTQRQMLNTQSLRFPNPEPILMGTKLVHEWGPLYAHGMPSLTFLNGNTRFGASQSNTYSATVSKRCFSTASSPVESAAVDSTVSETDMPARIKFKRLDKTARRIMQILDKEAVEEVKTQREIPDVKPGYIIQLKLEVPENKRRITTIKGIVIARRNAGLNTTFRIRRLVAGVGVESLLPLYSPNIKEIKVLDKKKVRRAKLYYLREKMNALKK